MPCRLSKHKPQWSAHLAAAQHITHCQQTQARAHAMPCHAVRNTLALPQYPCQHTPPATGGAGAENLPHPEHHTPFMIPNLVVHPTHSHKTPCQAATMQPMHAWRFCQQGYALAHDPITLQMLSSCFVNGENRKGQGMSERLAE